MAGEPTLKRGHHDPHNWVLYAQQMLNHALAGGMHIDVPENGVFDEAFEQEVNGFKGRHGLTQNGVIDHETWVALHRAAEARQQEAGERAAEEDDQLSSPPREQHSAPGHENDEHYRVRADRHGNQVKVYDMDAESIVAGPDDNHDWNQAVSAMVLLAEKNTEMHISYVHSAVIQFEAGSHAKIEKFAHDAHRFIENSQVHFPWDVLVGGLETGLSLIFHIPAETLVAKFGNWIFEKVNHALTSELGAALSAQADPVANLQHQLEVGVRGLIAHVDQQTVQAVDDVKASIPMYIHEAMLGETQVTMDYTWISEMVEWFGFPTTTADNVTHPILYHLNAQLDAMIYQVDEKLYESL
jgi:hypothetical protein